MVNETERKLYEIIDEIPVTEDNRKKITEIKLAVKAGEYKEALAKLKELNDEKKKEQEKEEENFVEENEEGMFPSKLKNPELERIYMGLLLENPKSISRYYYVYRECYFEDDDVLNVYKSVLFTEGGKYTPEIAKDGFNFAKDSEEVYKFKNELKKNVRDKNYDMEKIYTELKKLFTLRRAYLSNPVKNIQDKIVEIIDYKL